MQRNGFQEIMDEWKANGRDPENDYGMGKRPEDMTDAELYEYIWLDNWFVAEQLAGLWRARAKEGK